MNLPFEIANNWDEHESLEKPILWIKNETGDSAIYSGLTEGKNYEIRMNDFPDEPLYTLLIGGEEIIHFDDWPKFWTKPM